ncbi:MAG: hypothetical protein IPN13_11135 [Bacteroidetes bacterium]|nr:hypothetical protein [Bacteroidota bacterium]
MAVPGVTVTVSCAYKGMLEIVSLHKTKYCIGEIPGNLILPVLSDIPELTLP